MMRALGPLLAVAVALTTVATFGTSSAAFTARAANPSNQTATLLVEPPSGTTATSAPAGAVTLSWAASPTVPGTGHTLSYVVFRGPVGGPYSQIAETAATVTSFTDTPAGDGSYSYVVRTKVSGTGSFTSGESASAPGISDRTAPAMAITCDGAACGAGWYAAAVTVVIAGSDGGTGMASVTRGVDGGTSTVVLAASATFGVTGDSAGHVVSYYGADRAGNVSAQATQTIRIDTTAPTAATSLVAAPGTKGTPATITLTWTAGTDALSGLQGYEIRWTNAVTSCPAPSTTSYPNSMTVGPLTSATVPSTGTLTSGAKYCAYLVAIDNAGNRSAPSTAAGPTAAK